MRNVAVYPRKKSPFYYVSYPCPKRLKRVHEATPFRIDDPAGERKAYLLAMEKSDGATVLMSGSKAERFEVWVVPWLDLQYRHSPITRARYTASWFRWRKYLQEVAKVGVPRAITYAQIRGFHEWRTQQKTRTGRCVGTNTAICDIRAMGVVMSEAIRRGFADTNPCTRTGISKDPVRKAHRLMPEELSLIESELPKWIEKHPGREWMMTAYIIARYQGCRLRETRLNLKSQVDLRARQITFIAKGRNGKPNEFPTMMHEKVRPLLERLIAKKQAYTLEFPPCPSIHWRRFLDSIGLTNAWFHCLRSTVATELALGGVPISLAMRYMGHAREEIHQAYQDIHARDLTACAAVVGSAG
jgi:integrase